MKDGYVTRLIDWLIDWFGMPVFRAWVFSSTSKYTCCTCLWWQMDLFFLSKMMMMMSSFPFFLSFLRFFARQSNENKVLHNFNPKKTKACNFNPTKTKSCTTSIQRKQSLAQLQSKEKKVLHNFFNPKKRKVLCNFNRTKKRKKSCTTSIQRKKKSLAISS